MQRRLGKRYRISAITAWKAALPAWSVATDRLDQELRETASKDRWEAGTDSGNGEKRKMSTLLCCTLSCKPMMARRSDHPVALKAARASWERVFFSCETVSRWVADGTAARLDLVVRGQKNTEVVYSAPTPGCTNTHIGMQRREQDKHGRYQRVG